MKSCGLRHFRGFQPISTNSPTKNFRWPSFTFRPIKNHYIISRSHGMGGDVGFSVGGRVGSFPLSPLPLSLSYFIPLLSPFFPSFFLSLFNFLTSIPLPLSVIFSDFWILDGFDFLSLARIVPLSLSFYFHFPFSLFQSLSLLSHFPLPFSSLFSLFNFLII